MEGISAISRLRDTFRRHERKLVAITLSGLLVSWTVFAVVAVVDNIRSAVLDRVEKAVTYWDDRWARRVEYGESLVDSGRYAEAAKYLSSVDREFPAQNVKHKRGMERGRVLRALARSYAQMGRKRLTLDTYRRLVEFDRRDFESHYLLAMAALQFHEPAEAVEHLAHVLAIHPTSLASVRIYVRRLFEQADFASVVSAYEAYLNAFLIQEVLLTLGNVSAKAHIPVDGLFHDVEFRFSQPQRLLDDLALSTGGYAGELDRVTFEAPLEVGKTGGATTQVWATHSSWNTNEKVPVRQGRPLGRATRTRLDNFQPQHEVTQIRLRLRLFKQFDSTLWQMVEKSYRNLINADRLASAQNRSFNGVLKDTRH